ncbi:MAG TPA: polysaccharide biosynthesis/export family protein [Gemmataceae bacterium]|nr:polysaccharide biosynthesis/export family protein [Gemmataceae bacterium]
MDGFAKRFWSLTAVTLTAGLLSGCGTPQHSQAFVPAAVPKELNKFNLPEYRVEPPDILLIEAVRALPRPPYRAEPLDVLNVNLTNPLPNDTLSGLITVELTGTINLGGAYKDHPIEVVGKTLPEIEALIEKKITDVTGLKNPKVAVTLSQGRAAQQISGPHLVRPDGTVALGTYGTVRVSGMTLAQVRAAIEAHLSAYLLNPEISVDVQNYNSKLYYVVLDGAGAGQTVVRLPITGNETVIDAISQVNGLTVVSSQNRIWVSRPAPEGACPQILPVDWKGVVEKGETATNYQILPGDRVFVAAYPLSVLDTRMARAFAPIERMLGITLLGSSTVRSFSNQNGFNNNNNFGP